MGWAKYLITCLLIGLVDYASAQSNPIAAADSATRSFYDLGQWDRLISAGNDYIHNGVDFPLLRLRIGWAKMAKKDYAKAAEVFEEIIAKDALSQDARYDLYLCNLYLNRDINAMYQKRFLDSTRLKSSGFELHSIDLESSFKIADNKDRGNSSYSRLGIGLNIFKRLQLDQSVSYFRQYIYSSNNWLADNQIEYYVSPQYALTNTLSVFGGYHYMATDFNNSNVQSNIGVIGLNFAQSKFTVEGEADFGNLLDIKVKQYNFRLGYYPFGNLKLYFIAAPSLHSQEGNNTFIFNQTIGVQVAPKFWLESFGVFGNQDNYIDAKGLYIYNTYDKTTLKLGEGAYYQLGLHALARISYTYEQKDAASSNSYNQHSITAGILWKF